MKTSFLGIDMHISISLFILYPLFQINLFSNLYNFVYRNQIKLLAGLCGIFWFYLIGKYIYSNLYLVMTTFKGFRETLTCRKDNLQFYDLVSNITSKFWLNIIMHPALMNDFFTYFRIKLTPGSNSSVGCRLGWTTDISESCLPFPESWDQAFLTFFLVFFHLFTRNFMRLMDIIVWTTTLKKK